MVIYRLPSVSGRTVPVLRETSLKGHYKLRLFVELLFLRIRLVEPSSYREMVRFKTRSQDKSDQANVHSQDRPQLTWTMQNQSREGDLLVRVKVELAKSSIDKYI
jgi:hypothetical protein